MLVLRPCPKPPKAMGVGPAICAFTRLPALSGAGSRVGPIALESREDLPWAPGPRMGWAGLADGVEGSVYRARCDQKQVTWREWSQWLGS